MQNFRRGNANQIQEWINFRYLYLIMLVISLVVVDSVKCDIELSTPIIISYTKNNNTVNGLYTYCEEQICQQIKTIDATYQSDEQIYNDCMQEHFSCTQTNDFEIEFEMCQGYCFKNMISKYTNSNFIYYQNCQNRCLSIAQSKMVFDTAQQEIDYPFYKKYLQCYESNCTNIIIESQNSQIFNYYKTIFFICYENQSLCKSAKSNYNVTLIKINCYDACYNSFKETEADSSIDNDFKSYLTCDNTCLNQTSDYITQFFLDFDLELNETSESLLDDNQTEIKLFFWIFLSIGLLFIMIVTCILIYFMRIHMKTEIYKYESKYTDSDDDNDQDYHGDDDDDDNNYDYDNNNDDNDNDNDNEEDNHNNEDSNEYQDDNDKQNNDNNQQQQQQSSIGVNDRYINGKQAEKKYNQNKRKYSDEGEVIGKSQIVIKEKKLLQQEDGLNFQQRDNFGRVSQMLHLIQNLEQISNFTNNKFNEDVEQLYDEQHEKHQENQGNSSKEYNFTRDISKNNSIQMNSNKNLKESMQISNRVVKRNFQTTTLTQMKRQQKNFEDKYLPPSMTNSIRQKNIVLKLEASYKMNKTMSFRKLLNGNDIEEMQQYYGASEQNFSLQEKFSNLKFLYPHKGNINNPNKIFYFLQDKNISTIIEKDVIINGEDDEKDANLEIEEEQRNNLKRKQSNIKQQSQITVNHFGNFQSNQILFEFNLADQSPSCNTNQATIQQQITDCQKDHMQFILLLDDKLKKSNQPIIFYKQTKFYQEFIQKNDINSPDLLNNQKLRQISIIQSIFENQNNINQFQQNHKLLQYATQSNQITLAIQLILIILTRIQFQLIMQLQNQIICVFQNQKLQPVMELQKKNFRIYFYELTI